MRAFIAIPVPKSIKEIAIDVRNKLETIGADVKWVEDENYHLTMKFLGDINKDIMSNIFTHLDTVSKKYSCFELQVSRMGFFPNLSRPRVLWLGIDGEVSKANILGERIDTYLTEEGFEPDRKRSFHLTLGRIRTEKGQNELIDKVLQLNNSIISKKFLVDKLDFMESKLSSQGPKYILHKSFWLKG